MFRSSAGATFAAAVDVATFAATRQETALQAEDQRKANCKCFDVQGK
jgi:hypothetical protein